ncbi:hypothetical protein NKH77_19430 [Streptomyces sp. M19]
MLGGNELTTAALAGKYQGYSRLRLYHAAHTLPAADRRNAQAARDFNASYAGTYRDKDLWRDDGRAALAYDAMLVMAQAVYDVYAGSGGRDLDRGAVHTDLRNNARRQGPAGSSTSPEATTRSRGTSPRDRLPHGQGLGTGAVLRRVRAARRRHTLGPGAPDGGWACPRDE